MIRICDIIKEGGEFYGYQTLYTGLWCWRRCGDCYGSASARRTETGQNHSQ